MYIKLTTPKETSIYVNSRHLSHIYLVDGKTVVQYSSGVVDEVVESVETILSMLQEDVCTK